MTDAHDLEDLPADSKAPQSARLVELAEGRYTLGADLTGAPHAVEIDGAHVAVPLRGRGSLRAELSSAYFDATGRAPSQTALADALAVLEGRALGADRAPVHLRVAPGVDGVGVVLDLGDAVGHAVVVRPGRWRVVDRSPVTFRRTALTGELPWPAEEAGDLDRLRRHLNVSDELYELVVGWLVAALMPGIPHPIAAALGEQGTAKTTFAARVGGTIDASPALVRTAPRDPESWVLTAAGSWVVALDNLSSVPPWMSDALCRAVTGDGLVRRQLYTDGDLSVTSLRRVIILTAIDAGALRGDLAERLVPFELERIPAGNRMLDAELAARWEQDHPYILGGLLDLVAEVLAVLPNTVVADLPRMADFALVLAAVDQVTGWSSLDTYRRLAARTASEVVDHDPVAASIVALIAEVGRWSGTAAELLELLDQRRGMSSPAKGWPGTARAMGGAIRRCAPGLRAAGVDVDDHRESGTGRRIIALQPSQPSHLPSQPDTPSDLQRRDDCDGCDDSDGPFLTYYLEKGENRSAVRGTESPSQPSHRHNTPPEQGKHRDDRCDGSDDVAPLDLADGIPAEDLADYDALMAEAAGRD